MHTRGERADQGEVTFDAGEGCCRRFTADKRVNRKWRSLSTKREVTVRGSTAIGRHRRGSSPQEDHRFVNFVVELREL